MTCMFATAIGRVSEPSGTRRSMDFTAAITHEDPWHVARCLDVEVASQGGTFDEALPEGLEPTDHCHIAPHCVSASGQTTARGLNSADRIHGPRVEQILVRAHDGESRIDQRVVHEGDEIDDTQRPRIARQ